MDPRDLISKGVSTKEDVNEVKKVLPLALGAAAYGAKKLKDKIGAALKRKRKAEYEGEEEDKKKKFLEMIRAKEGKKEEEKEVEEEDMYGLGRRKQKTPASMDYEGKACKLRQRVRRLMSRMRGKK